MATYLELSSLSNDSDLRNKVAVALAIEAQAILISASPTAAQASWASRVLRNPLTEARSAINAVLAANSSATVAQIQAATDTAIQSNVSDIVDVLILAEAS